MSDLSEREIFSRLTDSLGRAIDLTHRLALIPAKGLSYDALRKELALVEGCCRQAAMWRGDARWLTIGLFMERAHQAAGSWLRVKRPAAMFLGMGRELRAALRIAEDTRDRATGVLGPILPQPLPAPHRDTRPVQVLLPGMARPAKSDILLPPGFGA